MTLDDVKEVFSTKISISDERMDLGNGLTVELGFFANLFKDASQKPTYDELVAIDGGELGYISFFDICKEEGILN